MEETNSVDSAGDCALDSVGGAPLITAEDWGCYC